MEASTVSLSDRMSMASEDFIPRRTLTWTQWSKRSEGRRSRQGSSAAWNRMRRMF